MNCKYIVDSVLKSHFQGLYLLLNVKKVLELKIQCLLNTYLSWASQIFQLCTSKKLWNLKSTTKNIYIVLLCPYHKIMTNISCWVCWLLPTHCPHHHGAPEVNFKIGKQGYESQYKQQNWKYIVLWFFLMHCMLLKCLREECLVLCCCLICNSWMWVAINLLTPGFHTILSLIFMLLMTVYGMNL